MKRIACMILAVCGAAAYCAGRGEAPVSPAISVDSAPVAAASRAGRVVQLKHLKVDLAARQIIMDANVCRCTGYLEFLVCEFGTKEHESIFHTAARPSDLHAALLALGLAPGKPAQWIGQDDYYRFIPPAGAALKITVRWKDASGAAREVAATDLLQIAPGRLEGAGVPLPPAGTEVLVSYRGKDEDGKPFDVQAGTWVPSSGTSSQPTSKPATTMPDGASQLTLSYQWKARGETRQQTIGPLKSRSRNLALPSTWVFVGSEIVGNMYLADKVGREGDGGEVISVSNFRGSVIDVPFESSSDNQQLDYVANTDAIPPVGTPVEVVISPLPGAEKADHARATLEIDRLGQLLIDNEPISVDRLSDWAGVFVSRHARAMVTVRADGMALPDDIERAKDELRFGGIREFRVEYEPPAGYVMPRTASQARRALEEWRKRFANPRDFVREPGRDAEETLQMIQKEQAELERLKALHSEYEVQLRQELARYKATSQAAKPQAKE